VQISRHGGPEELRLAEAAAHTRLASRAVAGKILLQADANG